MPDIIDQIVISVIIPYFQREPGILRRALLSVVDQELPPRFSIHCIIVDDGSPHPAREELRSIGIRERVQFELVEQANAGVSAARNAALDRVSTRAKFIACLDSDDTWTCDHLHRGVVALRQDADFYFSNCVVDDGSDWFSGIPALLALLSTRDGGSHDVCRFGPRELLPAFVADCPSHTSSAIYRAEPFRHRRFDVALRSAGEDHLFWFGLVRDAQSIVVEPRSTAMRGHGVDLYRSAQSWDSAECLPRLCGNLLKYRRLGDHLEVALAQSVRQQSTLVRQELLAVMVRALRSRPGKVFDALRFLWRHDKAFFAEAITNIARMVRRKSRAGKCV